MVSLFIEQNLATGVLVVHFDHAETSVRSTTSTASYSATVGPRSYTTLKAHPHTHTEYVALELVHSPQFSDGRHTVEMTPLDVVGFGTAVLVPVAWRSLKRRARTS